VNTKKAEALLATRLSLRGAKPQVVYPTNEPEPNDARHIEVSGLGVVSESAGGPRCCMAATTGDLLTHRPPTGFPNCNTSRPEFSGTLLRPSLAVVFALVCPKCIHLLGCPGRPPLAPARPLRVSLFGRHGCLSLAPLLALECVVSVNLFRRHGRPSLARVFALVCPLSV
jgi:hypothetical protein